MYADMASGYGKADAEEYQIVVAMAETLVPDVCALIMAELERIHIKLGYAKWLTGMQALNEEYHTRCRWDYMNNELACQWLLIDTDSYNWRNLADDSEWHIRGYNSLYDIGSKKVCYIHPNYVHAKLYMD